MQRAGFAVAAMALLIVNGSATAEEIAYRFRFRLIESAGTSLRPGARVDPLRREKGDGAVPYSAEPAPKPQAPPVMPSVDVVPPAQVLPAPILAPRGTAAAAEVNDGWNESAEPGTKVLAAPSILTMAKVPATIEMKTTQGFTYLEPLGDNRFAAKSEVGELGMKITIVAEPGDEEDLSVAMCKLEFQTSALVGREPVVGLDLDAGKPIFSTWSLKTHATVKLGTTLGIVLPSGPGQEAVLQLNVTRGEAYQLGSPLPLRKR